VFNPAKGPPTQEAFTFNYAITVDDLRQLGEVKGVTSVVRVAELEEVDCPGSLTKISSIVVVDQIVVTTPILRRELDDLRGAFELDLQSCQFVKL
jgi:hypothetical protein